MVELSSETIDAIAIAVKKQLESTPDSAALLGSASEIWVLIVLIIPGFFAFKIIDWILHTGKDFGQFQTTLYSLALSLGIFFVVATLTNSVSDGSTQLNSLNQIRQSATDPIFIANMFGVGIAFGLIGGGITKVIFSKKFSRNAWDQFAGRYLEDWINVHVTEGTNEVIYSGWLKNISTGKEKRDLVIMEPAKQLEGGKWTKKNLTDEMYFSAEIIKKLAACKK